MWLGILAYYSYPTIKFLVWNVSFKFLLTAATPESNHKIRRIFTFSRIKWVNDTAATNTGH